MTTKSVWAGRVISGLVCLPFVMGLVFSVMKPAEVTAGMAHMGIPQSLSRPLCILEAVCVVIYLIPMTSVLGAILLAGYMGGAIITHLRIGEPVYMQVAIGVLVWLGLYLREPRLHSVLPFRKW